MLNQLDSISAGGRTLIIGAADVEGSGQRPLAHSGSAPDRHFVGNMEMLPRQDSLSNPIHPERLSPPISSSVPTFRYFRLGSALRKNRRSQMRKEIPLEWVASDTLICRRTRTIRSDTYRHNAPFCHRDIENLFLLGNPDYKMRASPEGEWIWPALFLPNMSRGARDWCLISGERCGRKNMMFILIFFWDFCKFSRSSKMLYFT